MDTFHVYVRAWALGCFYSHLSEGADRVGGQLRGNKECPFSGVTKSGRVWRKVPESDARSAPNLSEGPDSVSRQLREDKERPFSGVTSYSKVRRKGAGKRGLESAPPFCSQDTVLFFERKTPSPPLDPV